MSRELIIEIGPFGPCAGLMESGQLLEIDWAGRPADGVRGRIFLGRVRALDRDLDAAFVDCGFDQDAWLSARDARFLASGASAMPITRLLHEGQAVLVQGKRDAEGGKGARV
ncbi:MAG: hypothetical protein ACREH3_03340, partial [Geminicoccales bacterium]